MNLRYGLIPINHHRRRPAAREPYLPALLERNLRLSDSRRIQHVSQATYTEPTCIISDTPRSLEEATSDLVKFIDANKDVIAMGIGAMRQHSMKAVRIVNIVETIFNWFDENVFMRKLIGRVSFRGFRTGPDGERLIGLNDSGKTIATFEGQQRAVIILNCEALQRLWRIREPHQAQDYIIGAVVHQMIHAYFVVACGPQDQEKKATDLLTHGEHFGVAMYRIKSAAHGLPLGFGNMMPEVARYPGSRSAAFDTGGAKLVSHKWADERKISTECARSVVVLKEEACKDWFKNKCLKTLDPDIYVYDPTSRTFDEKSTSKCGSKSDWVELTYKEKPYKVPRKAFEMYPSFKKKFEDSVRKLDISSDFKKETFEELVCFLCEDRKEYSAQSLRTCIELYQLAVSIKFEELKDFMLDALYQDALQNSLVHPTPEAVLDAIRAVYGVPTLPDMNLRGWAKDFMVRLGAVKMARKDPRLSRLRTTSAAFRQDVNDIMRDLRPNALACVDAALPTVHPTAAGRTISPPGTLSPYTVNPPPTILQKPLVQVTTTATQLPGAPYAPYHQYTQLPYPTPVLPHYTSDRSPLAQLALGEALDTEPFPIPLRLGLVLPASLWYPDFFP